MYNLRKTIDKPFGKPMLHTLAGQGYRLVDTDADQG
jgi:DNA-binding response OmpR family regulator